MKTSTKKPITGRFLSALIALCMLCMMLVTPVLAEDTGLTSADDPREGVMLITIGYEDEDGDFESIKMGTCFLINEEYVLTNEHVVTLSEDDADFVKFKEDNNLSNLKVNDNHIKLYLYVNRDMKVSASVHNSVHSENLDFAAVKLAEKIYDRSPLALGDSDEVVTKDTVYALGYPAESIANKEYNTKDDVSMVNGAISKISSTDNLDIFEHSAELNNGNSGGPLLDVDNNVIGINTFIKNEKNYSIQINAIKKGLDTFGIPYIDGASEGSVIPEGEIEEVEPAEPDNSAELSALQSVLTEAGAVNADEYTSESIAALDSAVSAANTVVSQGADASAADITAAKDALNAALDALEVKSGPNIMLIVAAIAAIIIVLIIIVVAVLASGKKKTAPAPMPVNSPLPDMGQNPTEFRPMDQMSGGMEGSEETTLLDGGSGETTLLGSSGQVAYLIRTKDGTRIPVNSQNFKIGKERRRVNYCVADNSTVSRVHCEIVKRGADFYVIDQGSANYTYVNGIQTSPNKETLLTDGCILRLSDEDFEFHLS
ncbi:MAG: trypsin-like peptidase domain-containing protein [Lachnospiraceae bacterium]|nr:trypsin-like peptidase domain-containing protein [Lachnospiraceae bacterium]